MVRLILGRAGTGKTARVFEEIRGLVAQRAGGVVLLVPEQYSHEAERELCAAAGDSLSLCAEVLSFTGLARKVFAECGGARPVMDEGGRLLCMAVAAEQCAGALKLYGRCRRDPRLLSGLLAAADELRRAGAAPDGMLRAAAKSGGMLAEKLSDLAVLSEAFAAVEDRSAADPAQVLETLAALLADSLSARGRFYVDGFSDFTAPERDVLRALIAAGAELTVCLTCSGEADDEVFALPLTTAQWLSRTARDCGQDCAEERMDGPEATGPIRFLCEHLFSFGAADPPAVNGEVTLLTAPDIFSECELAAAGMARLARAGCRWRDMAVAVRGFGDYRTALECACDMYGVPVFLAGRGDMLRRSVPTLLLSALETVLHGWEYDAVFSCLKTGLAGAEPAELDELENYCVLWSVRGSQWSRDFTLHPEGYNREFDDAANERLAALNALRRRLSAPLAALEAALRAARTARELAGALCGYCADIELPRTLQERAAALRGTRPEAAAETERLWDIVCGALEQFACVLGDMPMDAEQFAALFSLMLSRYDVGLIPLSLDRVQAGELDAMRRRHVKHLFLLGSTDARLPAPAPEGGLFSDEERQELEELGLSLGGAREELSRELGAVYNCLSLPSDSLTVSRPLRDADGDETRPSVVTERAMLLLGLEERPGSLLRARTLAQEPMRGLAVLAGAGSREPLCLAARQVFEDRGEGGELARLARAAARERGRLSQASVLALYGPRPRLSATRAERFNDCRFGYFLQFGLKARPRQSAVFDPRDYGTFMHYALEYVAREVLARGGFSKVDRAGIEALADAALDEYVRTRLNDFAERTPRFIYLFKRLRDTVRQVCADMWEELRSSRFQPLELELDLAAPGVLEPEADDGGSRLTGRVDRLDGWVRDDVLYIKVTDYKTGVKKFSLSDVCQGMELQLLLYLFTLQNRGAAHFGAKKLAPAGALYVPARFETLHADGPLSEAELAELRASRTRRSGLVLADDEVLEAMEPGEQKRFIPVKLKKDGSVTGDALATAERFGALERYVEKTLSALAEQLRAGSVQADPWFKSARSSACAFCDYRQACLFDESADCLRVLTGLKTPEAWARIEAGEVPV